MDRNALRFMHGTGNVHLECSTRYYVPYTLNILEKFRHYMDDCIII